MGEQLYLACMSWSSILSKRMTWCATNIVRRQSILRSQFFSTGCRNSGLRQFIARRSPFINRAHFIKRRFKTDEAAARAARNAGSVKQEVDYEGVWGWIKTFPKRHPFIMNLMVTSTTYGTADFMTQSATSPEIDRSRTFKFACCGVGVAALNWLFYVRIFVNLVPQSVIFSNLPWAQKAAKLKTLEGWAIVLKQVALDNFFYTPVVFFPLFYMMKMVLEGTHELASVVPEALSTYWENCFVDNGVSMVIWIPGDLTVFIVPAWCRMITMQCFTFSLSACLSFMRGGAEEGHSLPARTPSHFRVEAPSGSLLRTPSQIRTCGL